VPVKKEAKGKENADPVGSTYIYIVDLDLHVFS